MILRTWTKVPIDRRQVFQTEDHVLHLPRTHLKAMKYHLHTIIWSISINDQSVTPYIHARQAFYGADWPV